MASTFENVPNLTEVSLGISRLLIAEFPQAYTVARIDLNALPAGFVDLGSVVEDTPTLAVTREKFQLTTGIPNVLQKEFVVGLSGTLELSLHSQHWRKIQFAFGNVTPVSSVTVLSTIASVTDENTFTVVNTTDVESLVLGRQFAFAALESELDKADTAESRVSSITSDGLTFFIKPTPIHTPVVNDVIGIYDFVCQVIGTACIREHVLLGVTDFIDSSQVVHHFFKVTPGDEFTEEIRPTENARIPLSFNAFGVPRNDIPGLSSSQLAIAYRYYFPGNDPDLCT